MPIASTVSDRTLYFEGLVPLTIGVTGHRDLVPEEVPLIRRAVHEFFLELRERFPDRPLEVLSALAEGADRLVAEVALDLGLQLAVPLPMAKELYLCDFVTEASRKRFEYLCNRAQAVYELPIAPGNRQDELAEHGEQRNRQYAQLGVFLCAHSHMLLALWDGKPSEDVGGTAQVVRFHHDDVMTGYAPSAAVNQQALVEDDSDLVYHIVVSRQRPDGAPAEDLEPLSSSWLTTDDAAPRTAELPERYGRTFERTSAFNREARKNYQRIAAECYPLVDEESAAELPQAIQRINLFFCAADWLAIHFQRRTLMSLRVTHALAFVMGMMFILYSDFEARRPFMIAFFVFFIIALAAHSVAARRDWHSKYLEYRALAEGLRVQFYWAAAGVTAEAITKYSHDNFLQKQDPELGWIRNVMRVAGIGCDVTPNLDPSDLEFVFDEWVGSEQGGGQLKYYRTKTAQFIKQSKRLERNGRILGVVVTALLVLCAVTASDDIRNFVFIALGTLLLAFSIRQAYSHRIAEKELIKQYEFMYSIFNKARKRMLGAANDSERRRILRALGESALDEHAEWIFLHRERPPDPGGLWRMES
jgi:hypothetical protein